MTPVHIGSFYALMGSCWQGGYRLSCLPHIVVQLNNNCNCLEEYSNRIGTILGTIAPNGWCMRCTTGAIFCPSWIFSAVGEMICKRCDRQYGVYNMLAAVNYFIRSVKEYSSTHESSGFFDGSSINSKNILIAHSSAKSTGE